AVVTLAVFVCALSIHAATIRLSFGMARDGQLPGANILARVNHNLGTPAIAGVVTGIVAGLPLFASQQLGTIVTGATGLIYLSYLMCNLSLLRARAGGWPRRAAPFSLGKWAWPVNILAVVWGASMLVNIGWVRGLTNPPLGFGPSWMSDKPIFESLIALIVVVGAVYYLATERIRAGATAVLPVPAPAV
ncbi:MAG: amino acid permease, partial [Chloroflexota bacterium]